jgi:hypothetical protein
MLPFLSEQARRNWMPVAEPVAETDRVGPLQKDDLSVGKNQTQSSPEVLSDRHRKALNLMPGHQMLC